MTLHITEIIWIIIIHWFADFPFQTDKEALGKSKNNTMLLKHTSKYTLTLFLGFIPLLFYNFYNGILLTDIYIMIMLFCLITFIFHTITDYITSRITSKLFDKNLYYQKFPKIGGFSMIGIDQILHYVQLFITYILIFK